MIINTEKTQVIGTFSSKMKRFGIKTSAKTFKILSNNIYKYKIRAVIREISCNAVDGHKALKATGAYVRDKFDITMPTVLDPRFICRDYGIGLSKDSVFDIFTTYFESTKEDTNDQIGALGLGSKSPFCYTDTFSIVSWFGGKKTTYTAFIQDGEPMVMIVSEVDSDEPTGVEITVPVGDDINTWYREANYIYATFEEYIPNFIDNLSTSTQIKYDERGVYVGRLNHYDYRVYAVMGSIAYPVPTEYVTPYLAGLSKHNSVMIRYEIGELDIMPSREELSLDTVTVNNLIERINNLDRYYVDNISYIVESATDIRDLYKTLQSYADFVWDSVVNSMKLKDDTMTILERKRIISAYKIPYNQIPDYKISFGANGIRRSKFRYLSDTVGVHHLDCPNIIVNDLPEIKKANDTIRKIYRLKKLTSDVLIFDLNTFGTSTVYNKDYSDIYKEKLESYLSMWYGRTQKVIFLSKVKESIDQEFKDADIVVTPRQKAKPIEVVIIKPSGDFNTKTMNAEEIKSLTGIYCGYSIDGYSMFKMVDGVIRNTSITSTLDVIKKVAKHTETPIYIFRKQQWKTVLKSGLSCIGEAMHNLYDELVTMQPEKFVQSTKVNWINSLKNDKRTIDVYRRIVGDDITNEEHTLSDLLTDLYGKCYNSFLTDERVKQYIQLRDSSSELLNNKLEKFKSNNKLIVDYISEQYDISSDVSTEIIKDMISLIKWK